MKISCISTFRPSDIYDFKDDIEALGSLLYCVMLLTGDVSYPIDFSFSSESSDSSEYIDSDEGGTLSQNSLIKIYSMELLNFVETCGNAHQRTTLSELVKNTYIKAQSIRQTIGQQALAALFFDLELDFNNYDAEWNLF